MVEHNNAPETINQMLDYVSGVKSEIKNPKIKTELYRLEKDLKTMKKSPELKDRCNIDFKISNPGFYLNQVEEILKKDKNTSV